MSKTSEIGKAVKELHNAAQTISTVADSLATLIDSDETMKENEGSSPSAQPEPEPKSITLEEVRAVLGDKSTQGHTAKVQALIHKRGAEKLSQVDPTEYAALLAEAEAL